MKTPIKYKVLGVMSGTSLDGLDIAFCEFEKGRKGWSFKSEIGETIKYSKQWVNKLSTAPFASAEEFEKLHYEFGEYVGNACKRFSKKHNLGSVDFISSHGHTIFHQPERRFTFQLGSGVAIHHTSGLPVICDFRSEDVLKGGEGAPLVPVGDHHLFATYDVCLNIGGIANLSMITGGKRVAFDICFANMGLNHLTAKIGKQYDRGGAIASKGKVSDRLKKKLDGVNKKWHRGRPSLGREGFEKFIQSLLDDELVAIEDRVHTFTASIADEIVTCVPQKKKIKLLATGGGAFNKFLISQLQKRLDGFAEVIIPSDHIVSYKEAIVFAFLGVLKRRNEPNVSKSVTGASSDSSSGVMIGF
ncbi:MAG: anhydro-N-acetylmuramic acid kinase [Cyclobacteriaceae bacterium]|nr:anhydro-N-acetylmuramic acid kinase [Cyclobacteriaceae bacterium]